MCIKNTRWNAVEKNHCFGLLAKFILKKIKNKGIIAIRIRERALKCKESMIKEKTAYQLAENRVTQYLYTIKYTYNYIKVSGLIKLAC